MLNQIYVNIFFMFFVEHNNLCAILYTYVERLLSLNLSQWARTKDSKSTVHASER